MTSGVIIIGMIKRPTVLVLGAGASVDLGFPTGAGLVKEIIELLSDASEREELNKVLGVGVDYLQKFGERLEGAALDSIDEYLAANAHKAIVGKALVTYLIGGKETTDSFAKDKWYRKLFQRMSQEVRLENFHENRIAFVTFNYDRSLEAFLFRALQAKYGCSAQAAANALNRIPFIHVYGQAGMLPWQKNLKGLPLRDYGETAVTPGVALNCAAAVRTMDEGPETEEIRERAVRFLAHSEAIYFLGFGYSRFNLKQISLTRNRQNEVKGTHYPPSARVPERFKDGQNSGFGINIDVLPSTIDDFLYSHASTIHEDSFPPNEDVGWESSMDFEEVITRVARDAARVARRRPGSGGPPPVHILG